MKRLFFLLVSFFFILFLIPPEKIYAQTCKCSFQAGQCLPINPAECPIGVCDCNAGAILDPDSRAITTCLVNNSCTAGPTSVPGSPIDRTCNICKCEQGLVVTTAPCPNCDQKCQQCLNPASQGGKFDKGGSWSALGCIPTGDFNSFAAWFLGRLISIAGGIAFLLVIFGGFKLMTSAGDPKGTQAAKETMTSALIGLLFIIFSIFLLELIGVRILGIPGL